ncbi:MAG TPA: hypothetical protein VEQ83_07930 [Lapillicoccus sp.]|jgi:hypothetical protein|nr:hypothetical protein [Lapillicoccus sp.]
MTEFHAQLRARALEAVNDLTAAQESGDDYSVEVHRADLENIARIAREHGVSLPELDELGLFAA